MKKRKMDWKKDKDWDTVKGEESWSALRYFYHRRQILFLFFETLSSGLFWYFDASYHIFHCSVDLLLGCFALKLKITEHLSRARIWITLDWCFCVECKGFSFDVMMVILDQWFPTNVLDKLVGKFRSRYKINIGQLNQLTSVISWSIRGTGCSFSGRNFGSDYFWKQSEGL